MRITWYGHACLRVDSGSVAIVTDPCTPEHAGLEPVGDPADAVVTGEPEAPGHSNVGMIPGSPRILNALDAIDEPQTLLGDVTVEAVAAREGSGHEHSPDTALYRFELDGISICHMGDAGAPLTDEQLRWLRGRVDVLLALAGGPPTIDLAHLAEAIAEIGPRVVIPMHFATPPLRYNVGPIEDFIASQSDTPIVWHEQSSLELTHATLPATTTVHVLAPAMGSRLDRIAFPSFC